MAVFAVLITGMAIHNTQGLCPVSSQKTLLAVCPPPPLTAQELLKM